MPLATGNDGNGAIVGELGMVAAIEGEDEGDPLWFTFPPGELIVETRGEAREDRRGRAFSGSNESSTGTSPDKLSV